MIEMKKKIALITSQERLMVDLTLHDFSASLLTEFAEQIAKPYYNGNVNAAMQDLIIRALSEQEFIHSHISHIRNHSEQRDKSN